MPKQGAWKFRIPSIDYVPHLTPFFEYAVLRNCATDGNGDAPLMVIDRTLRERK